MKKMPLILSLAVNVLLVLAIFAARLHYHKMIYRALHNTAMAEVQFNEQVLTELQSKDEYKIERVTGMLEKNIRKGKQSAAIWQSVADRIGIK
ncbi:MAG: hypothetical protein A2167_03875 [Planctomycetes bacterium RBG_13_46_10]|nr:MAG: hypothetical protein A2167_03875 [Planctomycetes bacterium RBG_13_46_10]